MEVSERGGYAARYGEVFFSGKEGGVVDALGTKRVGLIVLQWR